jgi:hypothetical protein
MAASSLPRQMMHIERAADFLDDGVILVQHGNRCWAIDPKFIERPWAILHMAEISDPAPTGYFWLDQSIGNRKTIADCLKHGLIEVDHFIRRLDNGSPAYLAKVVPA